MQIFEIRDKEVVPSEYALMVPVFKKIWDMDKSKNKSRALKELAFVAFMCEPRKSNPYYGYTEENRRVNINIDIFRDEDYEPSDEMLDAIEWYRSILNEAIPSLFMYDSIKIAVDSLSMYFRNADYTDEEGLGKYDPKKLAEMVGKAKELMATVKELQDSVESEIFERVSHRGGKQINPFERRPSNA